MSPALLRRLWPLAAVAGLLALAAFAAAHSSLGFDRVQPPADIVPTLGEVPRPDVTVVPDDGGGSSGGADLPGWVRLAVTAFFGTVLLVVVVLVLWILIRDVLRRRTGLAADEGPARSPDQTVEEVVAALDAGLVDLSDSDADPRRAVIACWVRLEQAAAAAGIARQLGDTPTDLVTRLLGGGPSVSADVLAAFAEVYREARYATHTVDERMRGQARSALQRLRADLTAGVVR